MQLVPIIVLLVAVALARLVGTALIYRYKAYKLGCKPPTKYPHRFPWILDPLGRDLQKIRMKGYNEGKFNVLFEEQFQQYGPTFEERNPTGPVICTIDENNWRTILALKQDDYVKDNNLPKALKKFGGRGIFTSEGAAWRHSRDTIKPLFARAELSDVDRFKRHVDRLLAIVPRDGSTVDFGSYVKRLFFDSTTEFIFGTKFNTLSGDATESEDFNAAMKSFREYSGKLRIGGWKTFSSPKVFDKAIDVSHAFIDRQVAQALAFVDNPSDNKVDNERDRYILAHQLAQVIKDPVKIRSELLQVFLPAAESYPNMFLNVLFHLARMPELWAELRRDALALGDQPLTFELLKSMHSFRNLFNESLRIHGGAGRTTRVAVRDTVLPRGGGPDGESPILVPKGCRVRVDFAAKFNDPNHWGEDVHEFKPERFEGRRMGWDFIAFSGGGRICPAMQQVFTQSIYLLVRLTQEFEVFENRDPILEFVEVPNGATTNRTGVKVALRATKDG